MSRRSLVYSTARGSLRVDSNRPQRQAMAEGKIELRALTHGHYPGRPLPPLVLPGLSNVGYLDAWGEQDWGLEPHRNEGIEISLLETGHMGFTVESRDYRLTAGDVTITPPWQLHCLGSPHLGPGRFHWMIIDLGVRRPRQRWMWPAWVLLSAQEKRELAATLRRTDQRVWKSTPEVLQAFRDVAACVEGYATQPAATRLALHVNHLLLSLLEALRRQVDLRDSWEASQQRTVERFLEQLRTDIDMAAGPWTVARMAAQCGLGATKYAEVCRSLTNRSPWHYLVDCRLEWAARQLRSAQRRTVTDIALAAGFSTSQYFATCFHKRFHCSPRQYARGRPGDR